MKQLDQILAKISSEHLGIATLETRRSEQLDFHDVAVWQVEAARKAAFDAGVPSSAQAAQPAGNGAGESGTVDSTTPLLILKGTLLVPGKMYLRLYHGRADPDQEMDDWGFVGPTFGPLSCYVHTYCCTFRIHGDCDTSEVWLKTHDDMIQWGGCFYGDMEVFIAGTAEKG